jgi:hypothetical protein
MKTLIKIILFPVFLLGFAWALMVYVFTGKDDWVNAVMDQYFET